MINDKIKNEDRLPLAVVFLSAIAIRAICLLQVKGLPFFVFPIGDSADYYRRALEIMSGRILSPEVPFLGSVLYPYFMAAILALSGKNLFFVSLAQVIIGGFSCVFIYLLSRKLSQHRLTALLSGLTAAFYGPLVFFDIDLLMISITVMSAAGGLYFLLRSKETPSPGQPFIAGLFWGLACLDRANVLLFIPAALVYLISKQESAKHNLGRMAAFSIAMLAVMFPVTAANSIYHNELVPTGSNLGINFYIGNNPQARGVFLLPEGSGLENFALYRSSKEIAEKSAGRGLGPAQVSSFWLGKGLEFIRRHPLDETRLLLQKIKLFFNAYEIPNHLNFYFIKKEYIPALRAAFLGFWLVGPLALAGILWSIRDGTNSAGKLGLWFLAVYLISLLPFFMADRYRLPTIPVLIIFAWDMVLRTAKDLRGKGYWPLTGRLLTIGLTALFVNLPVQRFPFSSDRIETSRAFLERAMAEKDPAGGDVSEAIIGLKWALESSRGADPWRGPGHFHLARAYAYRGYYSGAIRELEKVRGLDGPGTPADHAIRQVTKEYHSTGDLALAGDIPQTLFERAQTLQKQGNHQGAIPIYREILDRDPFHLAAVNNLGLIYYNLGEYQDALRILKLGAENYPDDSVLMENICHIYRQMGRHHEAERTRDRFAKTHKSAQ